MKHGLFYTEETIGYLIKFDNGIKIPEKQFKIVCRTPFLSHLSEWREKISQENIELSISIQEKISNLSQKENFEILSEGIINDNTSKLTKQYIEIIKALHTKKAFHVLEDLIYPYHQKIHTGLPICDIGEYRKQNVWFVDPNSDSFNRVRLSPPSFESVPNLMAIWQKMYREKSQNPIIDSLLLYIIFESIHPLEDDNGKIGWILFIVYIMKKNLYFDRLLFYPSIVLDNKKQFYQLLENTINHDHINCLISFLLQKLNVLIEKQSNCTFKFEGRMF